jgi:hypothetical protein
MYVALLVIGKKIQEKGKAMLKQVTPEFMQIDFQESTKILSGIFRLAKKSTTIKGTKEGLTDGKEDKHFLPLLKEGLAALNITGAKTQAASGNGSIQNNMRNSIDIETGMKLERKQGMNQGARVIEGQNDFESPVSDETERKYDSSPSHVSLPAENGRFETQGPVEGGVLTMDQPNLEATGITAGPLGLFLLNSSNNVVQDMRIAAEHETSGQNNFVGLHYSIQGEETQCAGLKSFTAKDENGVPLLPDKELMDGIDNMVSKALGEKGIDGKEINEILAAIKERRDVVVKGRVTDDLFSGNADRNINIVRHSSRSAREGVVVDSNMVGRQVFEEMDWKSKFGSPEGQAGEVSVVQDSGEGILKIMSSDSSAVKGNGSGDSSAFLEMGKATVTEPLLAALREKGIDEKKINEILAAIKDRRDVVVKGRVTDDLFSDNADRNINSVRQISNSARDGRVADNTMVERQMLDEPVFTVAVKERESKFVSPEGQAKEVSVVQDLEEGILKAMPSDSNALKGNGRGDSSLFPEKGKAIAPQPFTLAERVDFTIYGSASAPIKESDSKPIEGHLLVSQIASQLPSGADKNSGRVQITLYPEHLGSLDMDIIFRENKVQVVLMAERHDVQQVLQSHGDQLRNALREQGLQVDGVDFQLRKSSQEMDGGSGGSHLWWREDNSSAKGGKREGDVPASSAIPLLVTRKTGGTIEGGISLFV